MSEQYRVFAGAAVGALVGALSSFLFLTDRGRAVRDRIVPSVDEMQREFSRFRSTIEQVGQMANDGLRVVNEFNEARSQPRFSTGRTTSH